MTKTTYLSEYSAINLNTAKALVAMLNSIVQYWFCNSWKEDSEARRESLVSSLLSSSNSVTPSSLLKDMVWKYLLGLQSLFHDILFVPLSNWDGVPFCSRTRHQWDKARDVTKIVEFCSNNQCRHRPRKQTKSTCVGNGVLCAISHCSLFHTKPNIGLFLCTTCIVADLSPSLNFLQYLDSNIVSFL